jgi:hypothetical protein
MSSLTVGPFIVAFENSDLVSNQLVSVLKGPYQQLKNYVAMFLGTLCISTVKPIPRLFGSMINLRDADISTAEALRAGGAPSRVQQSTEVGNALGNTFTWATNHASSLLVSVGIISLKQSARMNNTLNIEADWVPILLQYIIAYYLFFWTIGEKQSETLVTRFKEGEISAFTQQVFLCLRETPYYYWLQKIKKFLYGKWIMTAVMLVIPTITTIVHLTPPPPTNMLHSVTTYTSFVPTLPYHFVGNFLDAYEHWGEEKFTQIARDFFSSSFGSFGTHGSSLLPPNRQTEKTSIIPLQYLLDWTIQMRINSYRLQPAVTLDYTNITETYKNVHPVVNSDLIEDLCDDIISELNGKPIDGVSQLIKDYFNIKDPVRIKQQQGLFQKWLDPSLVKLAETCKYHTEKAKAYREVPILFKVKINDKIKESQQGQSSIQLQNVEPKSIDSYAQLQNLTKTMSYDPISFINKTKVRECEVYQKEQTEAMKDEHGRTVTFFLNKFRSVQESLGVTETIEKQCQTVGATFLTLTESLQQVTHAINAYSVGTGAKPNADTLSIVKNNALLIQSSLESINNNKSPIEPVFAIKINIGVHGGEIYEYINKININFNSPFGDILPSTRVGDDGTTTEDYSISKIDFQKYFRKASTSQTNLPTPTIITYLRDGTTNDGLDAFVIKQVDFNNIKEGLKTQIINSLQIHPIYDDLTLVHDFFADDNGHLHVMIHNIIEIYTNIKFSLNATTQEMLRKLPYSEDTTTLYDYQERYEDKLGGIDPTLFSKAQHINYYWGMYVSYQGSIKKNFTDGPWNLVPVGAIVLTIIQCFWGPITRRIRQNFGTKHMVGTTSESVETSEISNDVQIVLNELPFEETKIQELTEWLKDGRNKEKLGMFTRIVESMKKDYIPKLNVTTYCFILRKILLFSSENVSLEKVKNLFVQTLVQRLSSVGGNQNCALFLQSLLLS